MKGTIGTLGRVASSMSITTAPTSVDTEKIVLMEKPGFFFFLKKKFFFLMFLLFQNTLSPQLCHHM